MARSEGSLCLFADTWGCERFHDHGYGSARVVKRRVSAEESTLEWSTQALRYRDLIGSERRTSVAISEARLLEIQQRFASKTEFHTAAARAELTLDEVCALVKRQLQVEAFIEERFAPPAFISSEEIKKYYRGLWSQQRRERGLPVPPLERVRDEVRTAVNTSRFQQEIGKVDVVRASMRRSTRTRRSE